MLSATVLDGGQPSGEPPDGQLVAGRDRRCDAVADYHVPTGDDVPVRPLGMAPLDGLRHGCRNIDTA
jgi:hypothetical protein